MFFFENVDFLRIWMKFANFYKKTIIFDKKKSFFMQKMVLFMTKTPNAAASDLQKNRFL